MTFNLNLTVTLDDETKELLGRIADANEWTADALAGIELWLRPKLAAPSTVVFLTREQISMGKFQDFVGFTAPANPADVANRKLKVTINGVDSETVYGAAVTESNAIGPLTEGDAVSLSLADLDAAGNQSPWSTPLEYTVVDNVAPATPNAPFMVRREQLPE